MGRYKPIDLERIPSRYVLKLWSRVSLPVTNPDESCWLWDKPNDSGYGVMRVNGVGYQTHRLSYAFSRAVDPGDFMVCHTCDNRLCMNPSHLFLGTAFDNNHDRHQKGRTVSLPCERHGRAKLSNDQAREIIKLHKDGAKQKELASQFGISPSAVRFLVRGITWVSLDGSLRSNENVTNRP